MTIIAAAGTVIASAALFIVLSGFAGLKDFSLEFSSFVDPDLKVVPLEGKSFVFTEENAQNILNIEGIQGFSKTIEERVIIEFDDKHQIITLKGVDENYNKITAIDTMIYYGDWLEPGTNQIVSGGGISNKLSYGVLDLTRHQKIYVPKPGKGQITSVKGAFNSVKTYNIGIFDINEELNNEYVFSDIETARYLLNYKADQISSLELKLSPNADQDTVKSEVEKLLNNRVFVKDRSQLNDALYKMLNTENVAVYLIFTLVIIIALFNVVGAIIMMILDKKGSIHTLYNLGATAKDIRRVFFLQGSLMTILAGILGLIIGFIIVFLQDQFNLVMLTPSLAYPVQIKMINFMIVILTIVILGVLASKLASQRISKQLIQG